MFIKELIASLKDFGVEIKSPYISDKISIGPMPHQQFTCGKDVSAAELACKIRSFAHTVQFVPMWLPAGVEFSCLYRIGDVFVRYLEAFEPGTDKVIGRYDVTVIKCD